MMLAVILTIFTCLSDINHVMNIVLVASCRDTVDGCVDVENDVKM